MPGTPARGRPSYDSAPYSAPRPSRKPAGMSGPGDRTDRPARRHEAREQTGSDDEWNEESGDAAGRGRGARAQPYGRSRAVRLSHTAAARATGRQWPGADPVVARIAPGGTSALKHSYSRRDEFIDTVAETPTPATEPQETAPAPGYCAGIAGGGAAHVPGSRSSTEVVYLGSGDRTPGLVVPYPDDDVRAVYGDSGRDAFQRELGRPYAVP